MYGIFTYICLIYMVNVNKYTIHGSSGLWRYLITQICFWTRANHLREVEQPQPYLESRTFMGFILRGLLGHNQQIGHLETFKHFIGRQLIKFVNFIAPAFHRRNTRATWAFGTSPSHFSIWSSIVKLRFTNLWSFFRFRNGRVNDCFGNLRVQRNPAFFAQLSDFGSIGFLLEPSSNKGFPIISKLISFIKELEIALLQDTWLACNI